MRVGTFFLFIVFVVCEHNSIRTDKKLLQQSCVTLSAIIQLVYSLKRYCHHLSSLLVVSVARNNNTLVLRLPELTDNVSHRRTDKVILKRHLTLPLNILLLCHCLAIYYNIIPPLVAPVKPSVTPTLFSHRCKGVPTTLCLLQQIVR